MDLETIRDLTSSILDPLDAPDYVSQLTAESITEMATAEEPSVEQIDGLANTYYGHDMRYDGVWYVFRADIPGSPCGMRWWKLRRSDWDHDFQSRRCGNHNNLAVLKFTRRRR